MKCLWCVLCVTLPLVVTSDYYAVYNLHGKCNWEDEIEIKADQSIMVKSSYATLSGPNCTIGFYHEGDENRKICVVPDETFSISDCPIQLNYQKVKGVNLKSYTCMDVGKKFCLQTEEENLYINIQNANIYTGAELELKVYIETNEPKTWIVILIITLVCVGVLVFISTVALCCYCKQRKNKLSPGKVIAPPTGHSNDVTVLDSMINCFIGQFKSDLQGAFRIENGNFGPRLSQSYGLSQNYGLPQPQPGPAWNNQQQYGMQFNRALLPPINTAPNANELYGPPPPYSNFAQNK